MRVVLKKSLYLGDVLYEPDPRGVEIPETIKDAYGKEKKVVLWTEEYDKLNRQRAKEMADQGYSEVKMPEDEVVLPRDTEEYEADEQKRVEKRGQKKEARTLSEMATQPPAPGPTSRQIPPARK